MKQSPPLGYPAVFILLASLMIFYAFSIRQWILLYPATSFGLVAAAYLTNSARIFGKGKDGRIGIGHKISLFPYLVFTWLTWRLLNTFRSENVWDMVSPDLYIGRRTRVIPAGVRSVVDMACEFEEYKNVVRDYYYLSLPILDACPPGIAGFNEALEKISRLPKPIYIHCAEGHGRTGTVAAALLIHEKIAPGPGEALALIRAARPGVRLGKSQYESLKNLAPD